MDFSNSKEKLNIFPTNNNFLGDYVSLDGSLVDEIEYLRGQFSSLSYIDTRTARDLHVLRLRKTFEFAGIEKKFRFSLKALNLMREIQHLGGGFWRATSLRFVPVDEFAILVSSLSTYELQRHFKGLKRIGFARVIPLSKAVGLPCQNIDDWLGLDVCDSVIWCKDFIKSSCINMLPTITSTSIQYYSVRLERSFSMTVTVPQWVKEPGSALFYKDGIVLCRERIGSQYYRYFIGKLLGKRLVAEAPINKDIYRAVFGFSALVNKPLTVIFLTKDGKSFIHIPMALPRPEWQLLLAVCDRNKIFYRLDSEEFAPFIIEKLQRLGCLVRDIRD